MSGTGTGLRRCESERGVRRSQCRMPIEQSFQDVTRLPGMTRRMHKQQHWMEQKVALLAPVSPSARLIGAGLRDYLDGEASGERRASLMRSEYQREGSATRTSNGAALRVCLCC